MRVAVLSGKGGTGKTLVAVNLAFVALGATYGDCDVEEPNGHLFFKPKNTGEQEVSVLVPAVDSNLCVQCRRCVDFCKFSALAMVKGQVLIFPELCHSCGGCALLCPTKAVSEIEVPIGSISRGEAEGVKVLTGMLSIGKRSGVPIIRKLLEQPELQTGRVFLDCPPGASCTVIECIKEADYCLGVVESSVFGLHDFRLVQKLVAGCNKPLGVVLNKLLPDDRVARDDCRAKNIPVLAEIPYDASVATFCSEGYILAKEQEEYKALFQGVLENITEELAKTPLLP